MKRSGGGRGFHVPFSKLRKQQQEEEEEEEQAPPQPVSNSGAAGGGGGGGDDVPAPRLPLVPAMKPFRPPMASCFKPPTSSAAPATAVTDENSAGVKRDGKQPGSSSSSAAPVTQRFEASYTKNGPKKKKVSFDGVLVIETVGQNLRVTLESEEGHSEGKKTLFGTHHRLGEGSEVVVGNFTVEVGAPRKANKDEDQGGEDGDDSRPLNATIRPPLRPFKSFKSHSTSTAAGGAELKPVAKYTPNEGEVVLFDPADEPSSSASLRPVVIPAFLGRLLRPHQVEGVHFLWRCLTGRGRLKGSGRGAVLADEMGLGKTCTCITLAYVLLNSGGARKALVVCPSSLVGQWAKEFSKWVSYRLKVQVVDGALGKVLGQGTAREQVKTFCSTASAPVLILSYEGYRREAATINSCNSIDLLICDEGHRLKSKDGTKTMMALGSCPTKARLLVTGTPIQNNLGEFHAVCNFVNPGCLGSLSDFRADYQRPIERGRDRRASETAKEYGTEKTKRLMRLVSSFMIRRSAQRILRTLLPGKKLDLVVFCSPTTLQRQVYDRLLKLALRMGWGGRGTDSSDGAAALKLMNLLRKVCNHPHLVLPDVTSPHDIDDANVKAVLIKSSTATAADDDVDGDDDAPVAVQGKGGDGDNDDNENSDEQAKGPKKKKAKAGGAKNKQGSSSAAAAPPAAPPVDASLSGKLAVAIGLLRTIHEQCMDRVVLISAYTTTLNMIEALAKQQAWSYSRLDGSVSVSSRSGLVDAFNRPATSPTSRHADDPFLFLLSSRAGGVGLNLIGANRLILFDSDWNPSIDGQCKARVWRDGQLKDVYIYRLLTTGTLEEKILQRQLRKGELATIIVDDQRHDIRNFTSGDIDKLFLLATPQVRCETFNLLRSREESGWEDYMGPHTITDPILRQVAGTTPTAQVVSFVHEEKNEGAIDAEEEGEVLDVTSSYSSSSTNNNRETASGGSNEERGRRKGVEVVVEEQEWSDGEMATAMEEGDGNDDDDDDEEEWTGDIDGDNDQGAKEEKQRDGEGGEGDAAATSSSSSGGVVVASGGGVMEETMTEQQQQEDDGGDDVYGAGLLDGDEDDEWAQFMR